MQVISTIIMVILFLLIITAFPIFVLFILDIVFLALKDYKKVRVFSIIIGIWILFLIVVIIDDYYTKHFYNGYIKIKENTGVDVKSCILIDKYSELGIGDGEELIVLDCSNIKDKIEKEMNKYEKLPYDNDLKEEINAHEILRKNNVNEIKSGYYHIIENEMSEANFDGNIIKFTNYINFMLFDSDKNIFYYYWFQL